MKCWLLNINYALIFLISGQMIISDKYCSLYKAKCRNTEIDCYLLVNFSDS